MNGETVAIEDDTIDTPFRKWYYGHARDCTNAGFERGSSAYAQCYATEVQSRRAAARRMLGVSLGMMNQQPTIYKPPNHSIQDSSDTIQNRSYRFGNRTYHCTTVVGHTNCQ